MSSSRAQCVRLACATVLAGALWAAFVMHAGWLWEPLRQQPAREPMIEMKLVELAAPAAPATTSATHEPASPTRAFAPPVPQPVVKKPQRPRLHDAPAHAVTHSATPPSPSPSPSPSPTTPAPTVPPTQVTQPATSAPAPAASTGEPARDAAATASSGTGNAPARPLSQPLPDLPDDLRDVAWRTTAIARFTVHVDGSIDVELIQPTAMPRLNQLLLAALHRWRFSPATENGRPVESRQDVRVHFNVN